MYEQIVNIFEKRQFFNHNVWNFAWYHMDIPRIRQLASIKRKADSKPYFEYFPYFSNRTHQFANETKSTIRNVEFK